MRWVALILAISAAASADPRFFDRGCPRLEAGRSDRGFCGSPAFLEFAPATAAGLTAACAGSAVTGAKGETVTVTRASSEFCSKQGLATTGINNGDLVSVGNNLPSVAPDLDGVLGVLVDKGATNMILQSQTVATGAAATAPWALVSAATGSNPTVSADQATAPDGTLTADSFNFSACSGATGASVMYQDFTATASVAHICSGYVKGNAADGGIAVYNYNSGGVSGIEDVCSVNKDNWTRCTHAWTQLANTNGKLGFGCQNDSSVVGHTALAALNTYVWGWECVRSDSTLSSYSATTAATVTRPGDQMAVTPSTTWSGATMDAALNWSAPSAITASAVLFSAYKDASNSTVASIDGSAHLVCTFKIGGVSSTVTTAGTLTASASNRVRCYYDGTNRAACIGGTCATTAGALTLWTGAWTLYVGSDNAGANQGGGIYSRACVDPVVGRCI